MKLGVLLSEEPQERARLDIQAVPIYHAVCEAIGEMLAEVAAFWQHQQLGDHALIQAAAAHQVEVVLLYAEIPRGGAGTQRLMLPRPALGPPAGSKDNRWQLFLLAQCQRPAARQPPAEEDPSVAAPEILPAVKSPQQEAAELQSEALYYWMRTPVTMLADALLAFLTVLLPRLAASRKPLGSDALALAVSRLKVGPKGDVPVLSVAAGAGRDDWLGRFFFSALDDTLVLPALTPSERLAARLIMDLVADWVERGDGRAFFDWTTDVVVKQRPALYPTILVETLLTEHLGGHPTQLPAGRALDAERHQPWVYVTSPADLHHLWWFDGRLSAERLSGLDRAVDRLYDRVELLLDMVGVDVML